MTNTYQLVNEFNGDIDIFNFEEMQDLAKELNYQMTTETEDTSEIQERENKDFSDMETITEILESAQIYIISFK